MRGQGTANDFSLLVHKDKKRFIIILLAMILAVLLFFALELFVEAGNLTLQEAFLALFGNGRPNAIRIMQRIILPQALAALLVGGGLALAGLMMQTSLNNPMASPGTLGVSNAAVLGANIAIIILSDNPVNGAIWASPNPYAVSGIAFISAIASTLLVMGLSKLRSFAPVTIILIGVGLGAAYQAITTLIQWFAVDNTLVSAVYWSFGDLSRVNYQECLLLFIVISIGFAGFLILSSRYDALSLGETSAKSLGVKVELYRFLALFFASLITASIVSICGIIGFVGIVAPHIARRLVGASHRRLIPTSVLIGIILIAGSDVIGRMIAKGSALPVGAVTALIGAPFFVILLLSKEGVKQ